MAKQNPRPDPVLRGKLRIAAREMRREPTPAEDLLWRRLRGRQLGGFRFHRQYAIDRFITDFYCAKSGLIIELDGKVHQHQVEADEEREQILSALGFRVIRFKNDQVLGQTDQVLQQILDALGEEARG
jgi:very-short-patch-repair endonuclease